MKNQSIAIDRGIGILATIQILAKWNERCWRVVLLSALVPLGSSDLAAQEATEAEFDCVIEAQQLVKLASPVVGIIARLDVDRGDFVHRGQFLGKLEDSVEEASAALAKAKATNDFPIKSIQARLDFLRRKHERANQLVAREAASQATLDEAASDAKVAEQQLKEAELNLNLAQLEFSRTETLLRQRTLQSPIDGLVVERLLVPGEYRNEQSPILTLAEIDPLRVEVFVPIRYYGKIHVGSEAQVRPEAPVGGIYNAKVTVVDRVMDAASGTLGVRLRLPNPDFTLPAGVRCKVSFGRLDASQNSNNETTNSVTIANQSAESQTFSPRSKPIASQDEPPAAVKSPPSDATIVILGAGIAGADAPALLTPSPPPSVVPKAFQIQDASPLNAPIGQTEASAKSPENDTRGRQLVAPVHDEQSVASQPSAVAPPTRPLAGQVPNLPPTEVKEAQPLRGTSEQTPAANDDPSVGRQSPTASQGAPLSTLKQAPKPPSPKTRFGHSNSAGGGPPLLPVKPNPPERRQKHAASPATITGPLNERSSTTGF
jgi:RND family efflux transporter MFP subunit